METGLDRRAFLTRAAAMGGGLLSAAALERMSARSALADPRNTGAEPYGPLRPGRGPARVEVLALPAGFSYVTFGHIGTTMSDGNPTPLALDGMGAFRGRRYEQGRASGHIVRLIRNSEDRNPAGTRAALGRPVEGLRPDRLGRHVHARLRRGPPGAARGLRVAERHDRQLRRRALAPPPELDLRRGGGRRARRGGGQHALRRRSTATCSRRRCGATRRARARGADRRRGALRPRGVRGRPGDRHRLRDGGPGRHVRRRLLPLHAGQPALLLDGGVLHMLAIDGQPQADLRENQAPGVPLPVRWVPIATPDPTLQNVQDARSTFNQGWAGGGAKFFRLEGCWEDHSTIYFVSTGGGDVKNGDLTAGFREGFGQVWAYRARARPRRRHAHARLRVAVRRRAGLAGQPDASRRAAA